MNRLILIYNWKTKENESFPRYLDQMGVSYKILDNADEGERRLSKWYKIINTIECIGLSIKAVMTAKNDDIIVSMCATPGIFAALFNPKKKKILVLNLLCHSSGNPGFLERMRNNLYSFALNKENVWATCNANEDVVNYEKMFLIQQKDHIIHFPDGIEMDNKLFKIFSSDQQTIDVFSCGASARDWRTFVEVADYLKKLHFHVIARECDWEESYNRPNIIVEFNLPYDKYVERLNSSKLVLLPLKSQMTAGLLVMFDAVKYGKKVIITRTRSTEQFVPDELKQIILAEMGNAPDIVKKIDVLLNMSEETSLAVINREKEFLYDNYSVDKYNLKLLKIVENIQRN